MTLQSRIRFRKLKAFLGIILVLLAVFLALTVAGTTAAPVPPPAIQSGTAVIGPGTGTHGFTYVQFDFPDNPVIVVSLQSEVEVKYVAGTVFSGDIGAIIIELEQPIDYPVYVNWIATMPTETEKQTTEGR